ncbi:IS607 family transposase [Candidatus Bipolaricaulota bacterium]|nr:IS607 family transposase [Candidatus Bipolaricaulota bacterium]
MKLSDWARSQGITYKTAYRWFKDGNLPIEAKQMPTGTILVFPPDEGEIGNVALYARVSSSDQKDDLTRQLGRLVEFAAGKGMTVAKTVSEIGSGLNGRRPKLLQLLRDPKVSDIIVEHRDRLARFGSEYIEAALLASGRRLIVVDQSEMRDDLVQDMIDVLVSFCARLYGRRAAKDRAKRGLEAMRDAPGPQDKT